jgi:UDP-glucuronate 4-epimerase
MSPMLFARAISKGEPIKVFNNGDMIRDFVSFPIIRTVHN